MSKTKHTARLPSYGQNAPRWIANQIYARALVERKDLTPLIFVVKFGTKVPGDIDIGSVGHEEPRGAVHFNEANGNIFILLKKVEERPGPYDGNELTAGQVGPVGDM